MVNNPLIPIEDRLEIAIGGMKFRDDVITNLRTQIVALRRLAEASYPIEVIEDFQFAHIRYGEKND
jgi:hypothetical protein